MLEDEITPPTGPGRERRPSLRALQSTGLWRWARLLGEPAGASSAIALLGLIGQVILLRTLPVEEAGRFALLIAVVQIMSAFGNLGQPTLLVRLYSRKPVGSYDWAADLLGSALLSAPVLLLAAAAFAAFYRFDLPATAYLVGISLPWVLLTLSASTLNSARHYLRASALVRMPNGLLILPAALSLLFPSLARLNVALLLHFLGTALALAAALAVLARRLPRGSLRLTRRQRLQGLAFVVSQFSTILPDRGLVAVLGALAPPAQVATFSALATLFRPFQLLRNVTALTLTTELARRERVNYRRMDLGLGGAALLLALAAAMAVPPALGMIYGGRYSEGLVLVPWLALAGAMNLWEALPRAHIIGIAAARIMNTFILSQALTVILGLALAVLLTAQYGMLGTAWAGAIIFVGRNAVGHTFLWVSLRRRRSPGGVKKS